MFKIFVLPEKQEKVWFFSCLGMPQKSISDILKISRQATSLYLREALSKIRKLFLSLASVLDIDILGFDEKCGMLIGRSRQTGFKIILIYIPRIGIKTIFYRENEYPPCKKITSCKLIEEYIQKNFLKNIEKLSPEKKIKKIIEFLENRLMRY